MLELLSKVWMDDAGQDLVEYALIIALVAILIVAGLTALKNGISSVFSKIADCLGGGTCT